MNRIRSLRGGLVLGSWILLPANLSAQQSDTLPLKQAVALALEHSREVAVAQARYDVAANAARLNASAFRPSVDAGSGAAYTYGFPQTPGGGAPSIVNVVYGQTLFNPSLRGQARASADRTEVQRLELEKTRDSITVQTTSTYLELGKVRHSLALARSQQQSGARILEFTRQRVSEGFELPAETTQAELTAARLELRAVTLEGRERVLQRELAALLGVSPDQRIEVETEPLSLAPQQPESDLIDRALTTNLDVRQAELERRAREHLAAGEEGMKWPTIDMFGQYGLFARYNNFQDYYRKFQRNNFTLGLQVRIPILNGQRRASAELARSELTLSDVLVQETRQNVELEIVRQSEHLRELEAAREVARLELKLAQDSVQVLQARFEEGRANLRDLERARLGENDKWLGFLDSDYDRQKAQLDLLRITGDLGGLFR
jgi:outer membrane protein